MTPSSCLSIPDNHGVPSLLSLVGVLGDLSLKNIISSSSNLSIRFDSAGMQGAFNPL